MDDQLKQVREAITYAQGQKKKYEELLSQLDAAAGEADAGDTNFKEMHEEEVNKCQKSIEYLDSEIENLQNIEEEIEKAEQKQEELQEEAHGMGK